MRLWFPALVSLCLGASLMPAAPVASAASPEGRAIWICAFADMNSADDLRRMVDEIADAHFNTIFFQARFRGDAMYWPNRQSHRFPNSEPRRAPARRFDPLAVCIEEGHARGLQVHAYVNYAIVASGQRPSDPNHVLNLHPEWVTYRLMEDGTPRQCGETGDGWWMDPGIPEFNDYTFNVCMDIVENYDIDGLHFDRVRYPQGEGWPPASRYGYHPVAVARFNQETGRTGLPAPGDPLWVEWRKDQISNFLERLSGAVWAEKPQVQMSCTPVTMDGMQGSQNSCLQDWPEWVERGIMDIVVPQVYSAATRGGQRAVYEWSRSYLAEMARLNALPGRRGPAQMWIGLRAWREGSNGSVTGPSVAEKIEMLRSESPRADGACLFRYETARDLGIIQYLARTVYAQPAPAPPVITRAAARPSQQR
jgi:uncharacterized lipoprotein YddW (UPF0748 family)